MTFIYSTERRIFENNWAQTEAFYRKHGMSEEAIQEMREYDWDQFKAARVEAIHTQEMGFQPDEDDDTMMESPLLIKFPEQFTSKYDTHGPHSRYWWLEEISDPRIVAALPHFTDEDKELLTLFYIEGYTQKECAVILHSSQREISRYIKRILCKIAEN